MPDEMGHAMLKDLTPRVAVLGSGPGGMIGSLTWRQYVGGAALIGGVDAAIQLTGDGGYSPTQTMFAMATGYAAIRLGALPALQNRYGATAIGASYGLTNTAYQNSFEGANGDMLVAAVLGAFVGFGSSYVGSSIGGFSERAINKFNEGLQRNGYLLTPKLNFWERHVNGFVSEQALNAPGSYTTGSFSNFLTSPEE